MTVIFPKNKKGQTIVQKLNKMNQMVKLLKASKRLSN